MRVCAYVLWECAVSRGRLQLRTAPGPYARQGGWVVCGGESACVSVCAYVLWGCAVSRGGLQLRTAAGP